MGHTIIKPKPGEDFYVVYSSVVDAPVTWGTRTQLEGTYPHAHAERFTRANKTGSSSLYGDHAWDETEIIVREGFDLDEKPDDALWAIVNRKHLRAFCNSIQDDGNFPTDTSLIDRWEFADEA